ncbi:MAG: ABC transporter permease [Armatimonadota bacterium]
MKRLLWKEHHESWIYGLVLCMSSMLIVAIGTSYTFLGSIDCTTGWALLPAIVSMVFGAYSISREKETRAFEYGASMAVNLDKLMYVKALLALVYSIAAALLGLVVFLIACQPEYRPFVSLHGMEYGLIKAVGLTFLAWCFGFGLSVFGRFETNLHMLLWAFPTALLVVLLPNSAGKTPIAFYPIWGALLATPILMLLLHRYCRWDSRSRLLKTGFALISVIWVVFIFSIGHLPNFRRDDMLDRAEIADISPDGAKVVYMVPISRPGQTAPEYNWHLVSSNPNRHPSLDQEIHAKHVFQYPVTWFDEKTLICDRTQNGKDVIEIITLSEKHQPVSQLVSDSKIKDIYMISRSKEYAIYGSGLYRDIDPIRILDVRHAKWLTESIRVRNCWWQSDRSMGYIDAAGKRRILVLAGGKG